jgi:uncharacterized protein YjbI with pentapeptide repeats
MALKDGRGTVYGHEIGPKANLAHAELNRVNLNGADLKNADLFGARLIGTKLHNANLFQASLRSAKMMNSELVNADLGFADLSGAELQGADLSGAYLFGANLFAANLLGADLSGAELSGANFANAKVDAHHVPLIEAAQRDMIESLTVSADRASNPALTSKSEQELLKILRKTRVVTKKIQTRDGSYYDLDFNATLARALNDYEDATGKHPSKAVVARTDRFFRIGEYDL